MTARARSVTPETRALRLVARMQAAGRQVARVIIEGDRVELVLDNGGTVADPYEEWKRARAAQGHP